MGKGWQNCAFLISICLAFFFVVPSVCEGAIKDPGYVRLIGTENQGMTVEVVSPSLEIIGDISGFDGMYDRVEAAHCGKTSRAGYPELPATAFLIEVPESGEIRVEVAKFTSNLIDGLTVYPAPKLMLTEEGQPVKRFFKDISAYESSAFYPEKVAVVERVGTLRGTPVARVQVHPFQWNPKTKELRCHQNIQLKITFGNSFKRSASTRYSSNSAWFQNIKARTLLNYIPSGSPLNSGLRIQKNGGFSTDGAKNLSEERLTHPILRIEIQEDGIYRITHADLVAAGLPDSIDARTFQLTHMGTEAAIRVEAAGTIFADGDYLEFYAEGLNNQFTDTNVYWLSWGEQLGRRMEIVDGAETGQGTLVTSFQETLHVEENHTTWDLTPGAPDTDYWFWEKMTAPAVVNCTVQVPSPTSGENLATLRVCFQGRSTAGSHHTRIQWNGVEIGSDTWSGDVLHTQTISKAQSFLLNGDNSCSVELPGDTGAAVDIVYLHWIELDYQRQLKAVSNQLKFEVLGEGPRRVEIKGFEASNLVLYDITDPLSLKQAVGFSVVSDDGAYKVVFSDLSSAEKRYWIAAETGFLGPAALELWQSSNLKSTENEADWIVLTKKVFLPSVAPLVSFRQGQGLRAKAVAIEDVYNEFNFGVFDPGAIKTFLEYAYGKWAGEAPSYVLLAGDATMDYRDYFRTGKQNVVPPHLLYAGLIAPSDNWYVCMDGSEDILPDMFVGRIPGDSESMLAQEVSKITGFSPSSQEATQKVLLVADNNEASFENVNEALVPYLPDGFGVERVYLGNYGNVSAATSDIISHMNHGTMIANYVGHGSVKNWAGEYLFDTDDVNLLSNGVHLPVVLAMTCLNGYFSHPFYYSLAEAFIAGQNRGAIGVLAPSSLGYVWEHEILDKELFSNLFRAQNGSMGSVVTQAKIAAYGKGITSDVVQMFNLFGDPATVLREAPSEPPSVTTKAVSNITSQSAETGGNVTSGGGSTVTARGVCWSLSENLAKGGSCTSDGSGTGAFSSAITGLTPETTYYVRSYATNDAGTAYGGNVSFTTEALPATASVTTKAVNDITSQSAKTGGNVTSGGSSTVTARGVCWSQSGNPAKGGNCTSDGSGTGVFSSAITGLAVETNYYVRSYATNDAGTAYGRNVSFTTEALPETAYVCSDNLCGEKTPCYNTIGEAIVGLPVPDMVQVCEGVYNEEIVIDGGKEITIEGGWEKTFKEKGGPTTSINNPVVKSGSGKFLNLKIIP